MKAKSTRRLQEHFLVRFTFWAQPTLTGFLLLQVALNERTRAPLNTVEGLCSALWLGEKSDVRCILIMARHRKIHIDWSFFFASPCSLVCSVHKQDGAGNRLGRLRGCSVFTTAKKYGVVFARKEAFFLCVMVVEDQFQARALSSVWRAQNCWLSFGATDGTLRRQAPTRACVYTRALGGHWKHRCACG